MMHCKKQVAVFSRWLITGFNWFMCVQHPWGLTFKFLTGQLCQCSYGSGNSSGVTVGGPLRTLLLLSTFSPIRFKVEHDVEVDGRANLTGWLLSLQQCT